MDYWIILNDVKLGPMTLEDVRRLPIASDTPVWCRGFDNWAPAGSMPELVAFCRPVGHSVAPPVPGTASAYKNVYAATDDNIRPMPPTYLAWSIVAMLLCCILPGIVSLVYATKVSPRYASGDFEGAQQASSQAEMWLIVSIVCGLISLPFQMLFALL